MFYSKSCTKRLVPGDRPVVVSFGARKKCLEEKRGGPRLYDLCKIEEHTTIITMIKTLVPNDPLYGPITTAVAG